MLALSMSSEYRVPLHSGVKLDPFSPPCITSLLSLILNTVSSYLCVHSFTLKWLCSTMLLSSGLWEVQIKSAIHEAKALGFRVCGVCCIQCISDLQ